MAKWHEVTAEDDRNFRKIGRKVYSDENGVFLSFGIADIRYYLWEEVTPVEEVDESETTDLVNHPDHYTVGGIETKDFIRAKVADYASYLEGNIIKYVTRYRHKGTPVQDLQKAEFYIKELIEYATKKGD